MRFRSAKGVTAQRRPAQGARRHRFEGLCSQTFCAAGRSSLSAWYPRRICQAHVRHNSARVQSRSSVRAARSALSPLDAVGEGSQAAVPALKEWSLTVQAMREGRQHVRSCIHVAALASVVTCTCADTWRSSLWACDSFVKRAGDRIGVASPAPVPRLPACSSCVSRNRMRCSMIYHD